MISIDKTHSFIANSVVIHNRDPIQIKYVHADEEYEL
jgi:hypothetical protein